MDARSTRIGKVRDFYRFWKEIIIASSGVPGQKRNVYMQQLPQSQDSAPLRGLSAQQAEALRAQGLSNQQSDTGGKTAGEIIRSNALTFFNLIFVVIAVLLCLVGSYRNLTFLPVVIGNTLIGIFQELRAKHILDKMSLLHAPHAVALRDGMEQKLAANDLVRGDIVVLSAGDQIPADATVLQGSVQVNEALLTGESDEIEKEPGSELLSGSFVVAGRCYARLDKVGDESYIAKLTREAKAVQTGEQSEMIRAINRIVKWIGFTIVPIGVILFAQSYFYSGETLQKSVVSAIAAVIGMIPEGLYMLTTIALVLGTMRLARRKVLLHDMKSIETLARVDVLCVDKTGTITSGEPKVTDILPAEGVSAEELLRLANTLERKSEHPLAKAILEYAKEQNVAADEVADFQALPGNGLTARLDGKALCGGNDTFIGTTAPVSAEMKAQAAALAEAGKTPLWFSYDGRLLGVVAVADVIKEDSPQAVRELQNMGIRVVMITGDNERTAKAIGAQAGVDQVIAGVLPDGKEREIRKLKTEGKVAMVGDGINDAPALTRADIGVAIGAGTDVAIDAADVVLMKSRLSDVPAAIRLSRATLRNIHEDLFWAFFYNAIGIPLAAGVFIPLGLTLNPMFGAAAMSLSSFCVVSNALRLNLFKLRDARHDHKRHTKQLPAATNKEEPETMEKTMHITGMMCSHCEARVKKALEAVDGVTEAKVSHEAGTAVVTLSKDVADDTLKKAVEAQDYPVTSIE